MSLISIFKYGLVGVGGYIIYLLLLVGMVEGLDLDPVLASFVSFFPVLVFSYVLSYKWVFNSNDNHKTTFARYLFVVLIGLTWNLLIMHVTINWFNWWYIYSQALVVIVVPTSNYLLNYFWAFNEK
jgi:putative flippase GtrA